jgi:type IV fimbrial biogenesis protein FimT
MATTERFSDMKGYTLTELLATIAMAVILLAVGIPSFKQMYKTNKESAATNTLVSKLLYARSEAIKTGADVIFCPSNPRYPGNENQTTCTNSPWSAGFIIFIDENGNRQVDADTEETTSREKVVLADNATTYITAQRQSVVVDRFGFNGLGQAARYYEFTSVIWQQDEINVARCVTAIGRIEKGICIDPETP